MSAQDKCFPHNTENFKGFPYIPDDNIPDKHRAIPAKSKPSGLAYAHARKTPDADRIVILLNGISTKNWLEVHAVEGWGIRYKLLDDQLVVDLDEASGDHYFSTEVVHGQFEIHYLDEDE